MDLVIFFVSHIYIVWQSWQSIRPYLFLTSQMFISLNVEARIGTREGQCMARPNHEGIGTVGACLLPPLLPHRTSPRNTLPNPAAQICSRLLSHLLDGLPATRLPLPRSQLLFQPRLASCVLQPSTAVDGGHQPVLDAAPATLPLRSGTQQ